MSLPRAGGGAGSGCPGMPRALRRAGRRRWSGWGRTAAAATVGAPRGAGGDPGAEPAAGSPRLRGSLLGLGIFIFKGQGEFCVGRRKVPSFTRSAEPRLRAPRSSVPAAQQLHLSLFPYRVPNPGGNEPHPIALCPLARQRFPPS